MISNEWLKKLYKADENERLKIAKNLEKKLKRSESVESEFELYQKLAIAYGYIGGRPILDIQKSKGYWLQVKASQLADKGDWVWAQIQLCNLYRLDEMISLAVSGLRDIPKMNISNPRILFELYWVLAVCSTDNNKRFASYTQKARELYSQIEKPDMLAIDKYVCTGVWLGPQDYRGGVVKRWKGDESGAERSFEASEKVLLQAIKDCHKYGIPREVDPYLHLAIFYAFCIRDSKKAMDFFVKAQSTGVGYVNEFAKIIIPMCMALEEIEPSRIEEFDLHTNENENRSWWWANKIELPLAMIAMIEKKYAKSHEILKAKVKEIVPDSYSVDEFPTEFKPGAKLVQVKKQQLIFESLTCPKHL